MESIALEIITQFPTLAGLIFLAIVLVGELRAMRSFLFQVIMTVLEQTDIDTEFVREQMDQTVNGD